MSAPEVAAYAADGSARMGRWIVSTVPANWSFEPGFGLRHNSPTQPASNITVVDDVLLGGDKLEPYVKAQMEILKGRFKDPVFGGPQPSALFPADEALMLLIRHPEHEGKRVLQVQTYVRIEHWLGIITLSTLEQMLTTVRKDYEQFVASLKVAPPDPPPPAHDAPDAEAEGTA